MENELIPVAPAIDPVKTEELTQEELEKIEKREIERQELLNSVVSGNLTSDRDRVAYLLSNYVGARNSDKFLVWKFWEIFHKEELSDKSLSQDSFFKLPSYSSLSRIRAKIQNEYNLFLADPKIRKRRGTLAEEIRIETVEDKPDGRPVTVVFLDESGKNDKNLIIGSLWQLEGGINSVHISSQLREWKLTQKIDYEFHFTKLSNSKLGAYKAFFEKFLSLAPTIGFKCIIIPNSGFTETTQPLHDLIFHLLYKGITKEHDSGRAVLPRQLQLFMDGDGQLGKDILLLENIKSRLKSQLINGLTIGEFEAVDSKNNFFIQVADLFSSSINRVLNRTSEVYNQKDVLADHIFNLLAIDPSTLKTNSQSDSIEVFHFL